MKITTIFLVLLPIIYGKPFPNVTDEVTCGYASCHATDPNKLNVHLIPHSHDDVGWLDTADKYFYKQVQYVISSVVTALKENPERRFIQVETYYFRQWWVMQEENTKEDVRNLINEGRLEIINGGWTMNDEANTHYQSTIDQFTLGHRYLEDLFGKCARPKVGWSIDPFGHSREQASIYSQMGFDGFLLGRIDFRDDQKRKNDKTTDMLWTGSANLGSDSSIFTSIVYRAYSNPPNFCFDIHCGDADIVMDEESPEYNWEQRVLDFTSYIKDQAAAYPTNNIFITMGDDVQYQGAEKNFVNIDKLIKGFQKFNPIVDDKEINIIYSTPSCYVKAVNDYVITNNQKLIVKEDDFFPYATSETGYWTGFYSARPTSKRYERIGNNLLQIAKQVTSLASLPRDTNFKLENAIGIMQHHDAITGTEKQEVEKDYHRLISSGMQTAVINISQALKTLLGVTEDLDLKNCQLANVSICEESKKNEFNILLYNPLAKKVNQYVQVPVDDGTWKVTDPQGNELKTQLNDPVRDFAFVGENLGVNLNAKVLSFKAENIPPVGYNLYKIQKSSSTSKPAKTTKDTQIGYTDNYVSIDDTTGLIRSITIKGKSLDVKQELMYYRSSFGSGVWMFAPDDSYPNALQFTSKATNTIVNGDVSIEIRQEFSNWATQVIRIYEDEDYIEIDWAVGPIDVGDNSGRDIITRFTTNLNTNGAFYTDSNSRELLKRQKNYRPTFNYTNESPTSGNYHPITSRVVLKDEETNTEFGVITDRAQGTTSLENGQVEIMLHRATLRDEGAINEHLYEIEYERGVIARGSLYVTLGSSNNNGGKSSSVIQREIVQRKHLLPWMFFTSNTLDEKSHSFLNSELPETIHLLTLEKWNDTDNTFLIRLEHLLEKSDDINLSTDVTVDISNLFTTFKITSAQEMALNGVVPMEEVSRLKWPQIDGLEDKSSSLNLKNRQMRDAVDLNITLSPMQIRTFIVTVE